MSDIVPPSLPAFLDGVSVAAMARAEGTPLYAYSAALIGARYTELDQAFGHYPHRVHYALKANSTLGVTRIIHDLGGRADANSGGEIAVAQRAGFAPDDIVFTGVGKTRAELELAIQLGVHAINAESRGEVERIDQLAQVAGARARVAVRVNPDVAASTHPHISTGQRSHKFGVPVEDALDVCRWAAARPALALVGLHVHIGSQLLSLEPIREAATTLVALWRRLADEGVGLEYLDVGGGLGISYDGCPTVAVSDYVRILIEAVSPTGLPVIVEPGRWVVGPTAVLVTRVVDVKPQGPDRYFVVVDAGMSELLRPALYGARHRIELPAPRDGVSVACDVVGPICETSDVLGTDLAMPLPEVGDLVVVRDVGAYGSAMASNYNRHPLPAEVLVEGGTFSVIRRRQTPDDMMAMEV